MRGTIGQLISSTNQHNMKLKKEIFHSKFQTGAGWTDFLKTHLAGGRVVSQLESLNWQIQNFQALFIACWLHHPTEKGAYMIDLRSVAGKNRIKNAISRLDERKSSHLAKGGRTAAGRGFVDIRPVKFRWNFIKSYQELLVQWELTGGSPYLYLKMEGSPINSLRGFVPHILSWAKKELTGEGLTQNTTLRDLAEKDHRIDSRSAENFSPPYEQFIKKDLGVTGGKTATVREVIVKLYQLVGRRDKFPLPPGLESMGPRQLGAHLQALLDRKDLEGGLLYKAELDAKRPGVTDALQKVAKLLVSEEEQIVDRVFQEVRVSGPALDRSINEFEKNLRSYRV